MSMPQFIQVNERMLAITLQNEAVYTKRGAMVCFTGKIEFERSFLSGGNVQQLGMRAVTGEGLVMMKSHGTGTVHYAHQGQFVSIVRLDNETLYAESESLLAFDSGLRSGTMFIGNQGLQQMVRGAVSGQGLFTTTVQGRGELALLCDGPAIALEVTPDRPVCVDPDAYVGHKGSLSSNIVTDVNWKTFIGQTSGETYQVRFSGQGIVYIQASER
jgi:uncharacterized protein (AIM24 family)